MKATCTKSNTPLFKAGCAYEIADHSNGWVTVLNHHGDKDFYGMASGRRNISVNGVNRLIAKFKMPGHKSHRKMLVRAFVKCAKSRGWGESKNGPLKSWSRTGYNGAKEWARCWADGYCNESGELLECFREDGEELDQTFFDFFADEELDSL